MSKHILKPYILSFTSLFIASLTILVTVNALGQSTTVRRSHAGALGSSTAWNATSSPLPLPLFLPAVAYNAGGTATESVAAADVNKDGKVDLVVAIQNAANGSTLAHGLVGVLLGNGDGTFQAPATYDSAGNSPFSLAITDLNDDGKLDIAVANYCLFIDDTCSYSTVGCPHGQRGWQFPTRGRVRRGHI